MAQVDPTCALVLWDSRLAVADREANTGATLTSSYTEADKRPGLPVSLGRLTAQVSGNQDATVDLEVSATRPGIPGRDGCKVLASVDGGTQLGHMPETHIRYWDLLQSGASDAYETIGGCCTDQGTPIVVIEDGIWRFDGSSWTKVQSFTNDYDGPNGCDVCQDPVTQTLVCVAYDQGSGTQLSVYHSSDDGLTWSRVLGTPYGFSTAGSRLAVAANRGGLVALVQVNGVSGDVYQIASSDLGLTWTDVDNDTAQGLGWSIVTVDDVFHTFFYVPASSEVRMRRTVSPYNSIPDASDVSTVTSRTDISAVTAWADIAGRLFCLVRDDEGTIGSIVHDGKVVGIQSNDGGVSWTEMEDSWISAATNVGPTNMVGMHTPYGALVACNGESPSSANQDRSVHLLWLGGWSSIEPQDNSTTAERATFAPLSSTDAVGVLWLPFSQPGGVGFTSTGAGSVTFDGSPLGLQGQRYYTLANGPVSLDDYAFFDMAADGGGSLTNLDIAVTVAFSTVAEMRVRITTSGFRLYDQVAGATLATVSVDMTERMQVYVGRTETLYRRPTDDAWTQVSYTMTTGTPSATSELRFGQFNTGSQESTWYGVGVTRNAPTASSIRGQAPTCYLPSAAGVPSVLTIYDGPGVPSDSATLEPRALYSIEHLDPQAHPSPDTRWRSTQTANAEHIVWDLGDESQLGKSVALVVAGGSFRQARISYYDGSTWQTAGTLDLGSDFGSLSFAMDGDIMEPNPAGTTAADRFINENELVGGYAIVAGSPNTTHRILANTGGMWADSATPVPSLRLENASSIPATGTVTLVAPGGVMVTSPSSTVRARYWRVRFVAGQDCPDDRFEAGVAWMGRLAPFGAPPDWTWTDTTEANVTRSTSSYGTIRQRRNGPPGRVWTWTWADGGVSLYPLRANDPAGMNGVGVSGGRAITAEEDVWGMLTAVLRTHQELPVCALRKVPADGVTITDPTLWLYGILDGSVAARNVVGTEGSDEILRIDGFSVREQR